MDKHYTVKIIDFGTATVVRYPFEKAERLSSGKLQKKTVKDDIFR